MIDSMYYDYSNNVKMTKTTHHKMISIKKFSWPYVFLIESCNCIKVSIYQVGSRFLPFLQSFPLIKASQYLNITLDTGLSIDNQEKQIIFLVQIGKKIVRKKRNVSVWFKLLFTFYLSVLSFNYILFFIHRTTIQIFLNWSQEKSRLWSWRTLNHPMIII